MNVRTATGTFSRSSDFIWVPAETTNESSYPLQGSALVMQAIIRFVTGVPKLFRCHEASHA
jgi:hypothetical protein